MKYLLIAILIALMFPEGVFADGNNSQNFYPEVKVSWYAKGLKNPDKFTTACWNEFPKGTRFRVTFGTKSVVVSCTDRGHFKQIGRMLDLSSGAFKQLAPLSRGVIKVNVEVLKGGEVVE